MTARAAGSGIGALSVPERSFFDQDPLEVAPGLLGMVLVGPDGRAGRIIEVEAYRGVADPASHAYRGRTPRNAAMWGPPGCLYTYRSYGIHTCANVVCWPEGQAGAVLLRALEPLWEVDAMRRARWRDQRQQRDADLCRGPGRLCEALGVELAHDGVDLLVETSPVRLLAGPSPASTEVVTSPRVGISVATEVSWRYFVADHAGVSGPKRNKSLTPIPSTRIENAPRDI